MKLDLTDPVTSRFIARLLTLTPSEWEAIDARIDAITAALPPPAPVKIGPGAWLFAWVTLPVLFALPREKLEAFFDQAGDLGSRALLRYLAPAWRRQGVGPVRHLVEVLTRSYIPSQVRAQVVFLLAEMSRRTRKDASRELYHLYAPFELVIPWSSLLPPLIPAESSEAHQTTSSV